MAVSIHPDWEKILQDTFETPYFKALIDFVKSAYKSSKCFPPGKLIFNAFDLCPPKRTKVVILGQDPYHGPGQAQGLCFSVPSGVPHPPSLINIFKELVGNVQIPYPKSGDLSPWAKQGVLLLNATLTVQAHRAGSHQGKGWERFTDRVIEVVANKPSPVVFILWGASARKKRNMIDTDRHTVIESAHPSPLSAHNGFFGSRPFSRSNDALTEAGLQPIDWTL